MKKMLLLGIMAVALLAAGTAHASHAGLSLSGETGIARTPMAISLAPMTLAVAADYVTSKKVFIPARIEFGVIDGLEVGGQFWYVGTDPKISVYGGNAKYVLPFKIVENLGIALGANYTITHVNKSGSSDTKDFMGYGVATYTIMAGIPIVPSVGVAWDSVSNGSSESGVTVFGSVAVMVLPNVAVAGEVMSKNSNSKLNNPDMDPNMWFGVRAMPIDRLTVQAGVVNNANMGGNPKDWTANVGAQYAFGFGK